MADFRYFMWDLYYYVGFGIVGIPDIIYPMGVLLESIKTTPGLAPCGSLNLSTKK